MLKVNADKSRECSKLAFPPGKRFTGQSKEGIRRMEIAIVKRKGLVEALPAVLVLQTLRHLIMRPAGTSSLFYNRGSDLMKELKDSGNERRAAYADLVAKHLPETASDLKHKTCAVVGNAGMLKLFNHGELIDNHGLVIRINQVRANGCKASRCVGLSDRGLLVQEQPKLGQPGRSMCRGVWAYLLRSLWLCLRGRTAARGVGRMPLVFGSTPEAAPTSESSTASGQSYTPHATQTS